MRDESRTFWASDYAGIDVPKKNIKLYYGYEATDNTDEWCFEATFSDGKITIPFSALKLFDDSLDQSECAACLMAGIAILIERGDLKS